jgi:hypothetical protein
VILAPGSLGCFFRLLMIARLEAYRFNFTDRQRIVRLSKNHGWRSPSWKREDSIIAPLTDVRV